MHIPFPSLPPTSPFPFAQHEHYHRVHKLFIMRCFLFPFAAPPPSPRVPAPTGGPRLIPLGRRMRRALVCEYMHTWQRAWSLSSPLLLFLFLPSLFFPLSTSSFKLSPSTFFSPFLLLLQTLPFFSFKVHRYGTFTARPPSYTSQKNSALPASSLPPSLSNSSLPSHAFTSPFPLPPSHLISLSSLPPSPPYSPPEILIAHLHSIYGQESPRPAATSVPSPLAAHLPHLFRHLLPHHLAMSHRRR